MGRRRPVPTYPFGRALVRAATDALRIRSELPHGVARSATRYFDAKRLIKAATRRRVHRALAELLASGLPVKEGREHAALVLADAIEDLVRWWDTATSTVNDLPLGTGHERLGVLPGVRLLALDVSIRLGALLALCDAADDLELGRAAARGRSFMFVVSSELGRARLRTADLRSPNAPTRNGWRAWERGTLPRSGNVRDLPDAFVAAGWDGDPAELRARLRLAVALDEVHAWAARTIDREYAAGLSRFVVEVCRIVRQQPRPEPDETRRRKRLWDVVRTGARAEDAGFPLQALAAFAEPGVGFEGVALRRDPSSILVRWAVALAGATSTWSDLARSRVRPSTRAAAQELARAASRALRLKPPGYRLPGPPAAADTTWAALMARYWAEDLLGAFEAQRATAAELVRLRPDDPRTTLFAARTARLCGDLASANTRCRALVERHHAWAAPLVELARTAMESSSFADARDLLERARRLRPTDDEVSVLLAACHLVEGAAESGRKTLAPLLRRSPMHSTGAALMSLCCASIRGRRREARRWAKHAARLGRTDALGALTGELSPTPVPSPGPAPVAAPPVRQDASSASGVFMFTLTPVEEDSPSRWLPSWRARDLAE